MVKIRYSPYPITSPSFGKDSTRFASPTSDLTSSSEAALASLRSFAASADKAFPSPMPLPVSYSSLLNIPSDSPNNSVISLPPFSPGALQNDNHAITIKQEVQDEHDTDVEFENALEVKLESAFSDTPDEQDSNAMSLLAGVADLMTPSRPNSRQEGQAMDVDADPCQNVNKSATDARSKTSPSLERSNKPAHLRLASSNTSAIQSLEQSSEQVVTRFGVLQPQTIGGRRMMVLNPGYNCDHPDEKPHRPSAARTYVLEANGSQQDSMITHVPRSLPPLHSLADSACSSSASTLFSDRTVSRHSSNTSLASSFRADAPEPRIMGRPRSRTVNLPSISTLLPNDEPRSKPLNRFNHLNEPMPKSQNRPRSLSDVVIPQGTRESNTCLPEKADPPAHHVPRQPNLAPGHRLTSSMGSSSNKPSRLGLLAHDPIHAKPAEPVSRAPAPKIPTSHAHTACIKRFRCPLYSCSGKLQRYQSKVKAALLKCDECERIYWQSEDNVDQSLCPCYACPGTSVVFDDAQKNLRLHGCNQCRLVFCVETASAVMRKQME